MNIQPTLFLLDGMALAYRAHFAFAQNPRVTASGFETSAIYGFVNVLLEVLNKEKPSHIAVVFDTDKPTQRHQLFEAYKGHREAMPEALKAALPYIRQIVEGMRIPVLTMDGFEADDIIGTLAHQAAAKGYKVFMMTPDKDFGQLVQENVLIYKPARMGNGVEILGIHEILEKWEINNPSQVIDILGLWGDASDNIPGVPGIGEKTAKTLIKQYGSVENLLKNTQALKGKQKENLEQFSAQALLSKQLATIDTQVPVLFDEKQFEIEKPDAQVLMPIFQTLEFRTVAKRMFPDQNTSAPKEEPPIAATNDAILGHDLFTTSTDLPSEEVIKNHNTISNTPHSYTLVESPEALHNLITALKTAETFCFDTETTGIDPLLALPVGIAFSTAPGNGWYLPLSGTDQEIVDALAPFKAIFEDPNKCIVAQNLKYDLHIIARYGLTLNDNCFDTMLAHYLLEPDMKHGMDYLAEVYLNYSPISITTLIGKKGKDQGNMADLSPEEIKDYAAEDADITLQLYHKFAPMLAEKGLTDLFKTVEMPLLKVLQRMEAEGIKIDIAFLNKYAHEMGLEMETLEKEIYKLAGLKFNISSPKQLGAILFEVLALDPKAKKTKTGQYKTDEEVLQGLSKLHPLPALLLDYRQLQKLKSTYVDALPLLAHPTAHTVHTTFNQTVAATGRLSSNNPNLQNIPIRTERGREVRKAFIPSNANRVIVSADYSQIELRLIAHLSADPQMIADFNAGHDIHSATAANVYKVALNEVTSEMRRNAKTVNFGIIYGISAFGLSQRLAISRSEAAELISDYFNTYKNIKTYMYAAIKFARNYGYVETLLHRRRYIRDINSANATVRGFAERNAINAPVQGSAADLIKLAMVQLQPKLDEAGLQSKMILQVHDELVFDALKSEVDVLSNIVKNTMESVFELLVPLEVEVGYGENWLAAH